MKRFSVLTILIILTGALSLSSMAFAQRGSEWGTGPGMVPGTSADVEPFGVPLAPGIYLGNFMLLYFSSPELAANMPAYRAALPQEVYECLLQNPKGCPYDEMKKYFDEQALERGGSRNKTTFWPSSCQIDPRWQALSAPEYRQPDQINQPLGRKEADRLARLLLMDQSMILTDEEYKCMVGIDPPSDEYGRAIIRACYRDLTNSKVERVNIPLSSYGLYLDEQGYVRSDCATDAPCLEANKLAQDGSLMKIAIQCGYRDKLKRLMNPIYTETPFPEILLEGVACQRHWGPDSGLPCIVETACPGNGGQSNK